MKHKVGDKVKVKSIEWYNNNTPNADFICCTNFIPFTQSMTIWCGCVMTIKSINSDNVYLVEENIYAWTEDMFEGFAEEEGIYDEEFKNAINAAYNACLDDYNEVPDKIKIDQVFISDKNYQDKVELCLGNDYEIVVEDGRTFVQRKKPKYPKSFQECYCLLYGKQDLTLGCDIMRGAYNNILECLQMLLICRDAYWEIADFKYDVNIAENYFYIVNKRGSVVKEHFMNFNYILAFPTEEMRDAFYENFKDLIENCKEFL